MQRPPPADQGFPYSALRTGDYDEKPEISDQSRILLRDEALDSLANSVSRLGQLGRNIADDIEMNNLELADAEHEAEIIAEERDFFDRQLAQMQTSGGRMRQLYIMFIAVVLLAALVIFVYKEFKRMS